jgi:hypothetical protein
MTDEAQNHDAPQAASGSAAGQPVDPCLQPAPNEVERPQEQEIPIGVPMSDLAYQQLKRAAEIPAESDVDAVLNQEDESEDESEEG